MLGKIEGRRRRGQQRMRSLDGITGSMHMSLSGSGNWWWTGQPGMLQSMGSQRVWLGWVTELTAWLVLSKSLEIGLASPHVALRLPRCLSCKEPTCQCRRPRFNPWVGKIPWRRKWHPIPVLLPGKSHEHRNLASCSPWGAKSWTWLSDWDSDNK